MKQKQSHKTEKSIHREKLQDHTSSSIRKNLTHQIKFDRQKVFKEIFDYLDDDGSGSIDVEQILNMLAKFEGILPQSYAQYIIDEVDANRNGKIQFEEFMSVMGKSPKVTQDQILELKKSFKFLANGDQKISRKQLVQIIKSYTSKEDPDILLAQLDFDQNDYLHYEQAINLFYATLHLKN